MADNAIPIKNIVCGRCIATVEAILSKLDIPYKEVSLGEAILERDLSAAEQNELSSELEKVGFQLLQSKNERIINHIKSVLINEISNSTDQKKLSEILSAELHHDYSFITNLFTAEEGQSIQSYFNKLKIEKAKELLEYDELSIAEVADQLGFSTAAYLSTSFKKQTGITPSAYKKKQLKGRKGLDSV
ncbi:helix-turn-helix transcriptional regulator [Zunongwangia endophytica]|uniref:Helix-turn-helix domain-containing protein n=1 Tax=Zunongwangia endophytica TaxID=1808945 RepID=A0ABV8HBZ6_9FLAO|nr:helix-turn-helix transcriptional regulator [Zunongwangia endophytica]MDN3596355.1 helix-turn-helix transcriptional regulator [Zunongwangia endophytica]